MANIVYRTADGLWHADVPFVITCGCGGIVPEARLMMKRSDVADMPMLVITDNFAVKEYLKQIGLYDKVPSLSKGRFSVLFNPQNGRYIDLNKAPRTPKTYTNIRSVVYG